MFPTIACRGAFSYVKRVTQRKGKAEFAAKFISARGKRKASALREMDLLSELDNKRILYFHDAFEKKNMVVVITELYPFRGVFLVTPYNQKKDAAFSANPARSERRIGKRQLNLCLC